MIKILNTMSGKKEEFSPREEDKVKMFVCGPTVYDYIHIGNARTFVFFDVVAKYLRYRGYNVNYIQNITDIDDKIIQRANENSRDPLEWAGEYEEKFLKNMQELGVTGVSQYARATDHIEQVTKQVKTLIDKGHAYLIEGDGWYFDLKTFPEYGKLSKRTVQMADDAISRIDESSKKRNVGDFVLWKLSKRGEPSWDTELGKGRPGWHIEDTAISEKYVGPQYDIHGGGQDLIFPHHEAEITQQCAASNIKPEDFVKYWMHVGFLINKAQKMSKSLGNFEMIHELLKKHPKEALRLYLLSGYYRSPLDFSDKILQQSEAGIRRVYEFSQKLNLTTETPAPEQSTVRGVARNKERNTVKENIEERITKTRQEFIESMDDDFNTPQAFASIFDLIREINPALTDDALDKNSVKKAREFLKEVDAILGIIPSKLEKIPDEAQELVKKREKLREDKNWEEADKIRAQIEDLGYKIEDTIYGPLITLLHS